MRITVRLLLAWAQLSVCSAACAAGPWADGGVERAAAASPSRVLWHRRVELPAEPDLGQHLGTLLEIRGPRREVLAAAGFVNGAQTGGINDHRALHVVVAPAGASQPTIAPVRLESRPYGPATVFRLATWRGRLLAYPRGEKSAVRWLDPDTSQWEDLPGSMSRRSKTEHIASLQVVENELLATFTKGAQWGEQLVPLDQLFDHESDFVESAFYFAGRLLLSVILHKQDSWPTEREAVLFDCHWQPPATQIRDCRKRVFNESAARGAGRGYAALGMHGLSDGRVLIYGLDGYLYAYSGSELAPLVEIDPRRSWQLYSSLEDYGDLLLGHYPTANLMRIPMSTLGQARSGEWTDGERAAVELTPSTRPQGDRLRDEAQSVMRLGRDLAVGIWPWGEMVAGRPGGAWSIRVPSPLTGVPDENRVHPYEGLLGNNCMGMRIFQIVPWLGGVAFQTTVKNMDEQCARTLKAVAPGLLEPYGRVHYLDVPGTLSCPLVWTGRSRVIAIALTEADELTVSQDGRVLCARPVPQAARLARELASAQNDVWVRPAVGLYGRPTRVTDQRLR